MNLIIAHRGRNDHSYPDNTIPAFLNSIKQSYIDGIEMDVRMTKDHKLILSHNPILIDLSHFYLIPITPYKKIRNFTIDSISIPTLEQVLSSLKTNKKIFLDLKEETGREKRFIKELKKVLIKYHHLQIYICSFNDKLLNLITNTFPKGLIIMKWVNSHELNNGYHINLIHDQLWDKIHFVKEIYIWTVNDEKNFKKIMNKKSAYPLGIITDKAEQLFTSFVHSAQNHPELSKQIQPQSSHDNQNV